MCLLDLCLIALMQKNTSKTHHDEELLLKPELAKRLKVSERTVENWSHSNRIPSLKIGRVVRYLWSDVLLALQSPDQPK